MAKLSKNWKNNKTFLFLGFLFLTLFLFWPLPASAFVQAFINAVLTIPYLLITRFLIIIITISWVFVWLTGAILDLVISPTFITLSYVDPAKNQIIASGLNITQSFVNLLLVAALVYTALAIALRINETEAKKTLVRLIIVALLVNFAPVLCGLVVDAANMAMNYFLKPIQEGVSGVLTQIFTSVGRVISALWPVTDLSKRLGIVMMVVAQITMNFAIGLAFIFFAVIFLIRYIAIWILVILAPLAFVCWVLPQTKSLWNMWLNNFVQWSIIGIPIAFFLYLAMSSFTILSREFKKAEIEMPGMEATAVGFLNEAFPFFVVIAFLLLGFTIGLATSAMGSSAVINLTRKVGVWGAKTTGKAAGRSFRGSASRALGPIGRKWMEKQAAAKFRPEIPEKIRGMKGIGRAVAKTGYFLANPLTYALRRGIGEVGLRLTEAEIKDVGTTEEKYKGTLAERKMAGIRDALTLRNFGKAAGILRQGIEEEQIDDLRGLGLKDEEITKIGKEALRVHPEQFKKIRNAFPHLAEEMGKAFNKDIKKAAGLVLTDDETTKGMTLPMKIAMRIRPDFIPKMTDDAKLHPEVMEGFHHYGSREQIASLMRTASKPVRERYIKHAKELGMTWFDKNNPPVGKFLKGPLGETLYGGIPKYPPKKEEEKTPEEKMEEKLIKEREEFLAKKREG